MLEAIDEPLHVPKLDLALWVLLTVICGAAVYGTVKASKRFTQSYDSNAKKITAAQQSLSKTAKAERGAARPNAVLIKNVDSRRTDLNKQLMQLWQTFYDRQAKFLVWPKESGITPPAAKDDGKQGTEIPAELCKSYNNKIVSNEFERIFAKLRVRQPKTNGAHPADENLPFKDRPLDYEGLVAWNPKQREAIIARHCLPKGTPSSARVRFVQEDLWIFESLVDAIQSLNRDASDPLTAPLKQVDVLDVAQWATAASVQQKTALWVPEEAEATKAKPQASAPASPPAPPAGDANDKAWLDGRYLDAAGQPLKTGTPQPFAEFNQIFVFIKLVIDQRRLPDLLTALANAALPVETRQVTVQLLPNSSIREATPSEGDDAVASAASSPDSPPTGSLSSAERSEWDATLTISGVIYLYNPPNAKSLGKGPTKPTERMFCVPLAAATAPPK
jgi:hypothetical protein